MFLGFANFYRHFIQGFSKIVITLTSMLETIGLSVVSAPIAIEINNDEIVGSGKDLKYITL